VDPEWSFETEFWYDTRFPNQLKAKKLLLEVYDFGVSGKDKLIGNRSEKQSKPHPYENTNVNVRKISHTHTQDIWLIVNFVKDS
jgi:hypothetical protein